MVEKKLNDLVNNGDIYFAYQLVKFAQLKRFVVVKSAH
jgi:hypothetical protein